MSKIAVMLAPAAVFAMLACQSMKFIATENTGGDSSPGGETDTETGESTDTGSVVNTNTDSDSEADTYTESDSESGGDADTDADTDADADTDTDGDIDTDTHGDTGSDTGCSVPDYFRWTSSSPIITPPAETIAIKDPTVVRYGELWLVYATTRADDWSIAYLSFEYDDWNSAIDAEKTPLSENPDLTGYMAAPQLFYFSSQAQWYLVYQTQDPAYSTTTDPSDVGSWSPPTKFMSVPDSITSTGARGIDYWVICDETNCYMFYSADNGRLYRAKTAKRDFPNGFEDTTVVIMEDDKYNLFDACNVYKMEGTGEYLLLVSAIGSIGRYFRAFTADSLDGEWTSRADTEDNNFASVNNVTGAGAGWALDGINHGEMLRENPDETMTIDTCNMRYLYQGLTWEGPSLELYDDNEYSLGLLTDAR